MSLELHSPPLLWPSSAHADRWPCWETLPCLAAAVALPSGEPDPNCPDLRLWLRADAGVRDAAGHGPADPEFSGSVAVWSDQSARHFDLAALPEQAPYYVMRQPGAGNRPTVAFGGGRMLARPKDTLHDHVNSTTLLVLQIQRGSEQGNVSSARETTGGKRETLSFEHSDELDAAQGRVVRWLERAKSVLTIRLQIAADGRFAIVMLRSAGENSSVEVQDGLGDALGADREMNPTGHAAVSNQCGHGYCLGGPKLDQPQTGYDGQIAEVMVYNRALSSAERRALVALSPPQVRARRAGRTVSRRHASHAGRGFRRPLAGSIPAGTAARPRCAWASGMSPPKVTATTTASSERFSFRGPETIRSGCGPSASGRDGGLRTSVGGKPLGVTHADGPMGLSWQLAGTVDLQPGETEIAVRGEGPGRKECDAVLISPSVTTLAGVEEICALARRLRQTPSPGQLTAVFDDGRRIEGNLVSGWRGSGAQIARDGRGPARGAAACCWTVWPRTRPRSPTPCWNSTTATACAGPSAATWRLRRRRGKAVGAQVLVQPSQELGKSAEKPIAVEIDWLRRIVFDAARAAAPLSAAVARLPRRAGDRLPRPAFQR